jgi:hypothetical protein
MERLVLEALKHKGALVHDRACRELLVLTPGVNARLQQRWDNVVRRVTLVQAPYFHIPGDCGLLGQSSGPLKKAPNRKNLRLGIGARVRRIG